LVKEVNLHRKQGAVFSWLKQSLGDAVENSKDTQEENSNDTKENSNDTGGEQQ
jgi:hypothetical protein